MEKEETFTIFVDIPYEGMHIAFGGTLVECMEWLRNGRGRYSLDDLEIYSDNAPDVHDLAKEC